MDRDEIKEFLAIMTRLAVAMEEQAKHQQKFNEMALQHHIENQARDEEWRQIQLQWREENRHQEAEMLELNQQQRALQIQREDQWRKENLELQTKFNESYIEAMLKNSAIQLKLGE